MMTDELPTRAEEKARLINTIMVWVGLATFGFPPAIWVYQVYYWLKNGSWLPITIEAGLMSVGLGVPYTSWRGVQMIIEWIVALPLWFGVFLIGMLVITLIYPAFQRAQDGAADAVNARIRRFNEQWDRDHPRDKP